MSIEKLHPYHKKHSISEVVISLFLVNEIVRPERFQDLLKEKLKDEFNEFKKLQRQGISLKITPDKEPEINLPEEKKTIGFLFRKFKEGKLSWVLQGNNPMAQNAGVAVISIHCVDADYDWRDYLPRAESYLRIIGEFEPGIYVRAIGLNYIDQFNWIGEDYPNFSSIFNASSEFLPDVFFRRSDDFSYSYSGKCEEESHLPFLEKFDIFSRTISEGNVNIGIVHLISEEFKEATNVKDLVNADLFNKSMNWAHDKNKRFLKTVLTQPVIDKIGLK